MLKLSKPMLLQLHTMPQYLLHYSIFGHKSKYCISLQLFFKNQKRYTIMYGYRKSMKFRGGIGINTEVLAKLPFKKYIRRGCKRVHWGVLDS